MVRLLGENELVLAGDAQQVALAGVIDFQDCGTVQQLFAGNGQSFWLRIGGREQFDWGWWCLHGDINTNTNGSHCMANANHCQKMGPQYQSSIMMEDSLSMSRESPETPADFM